MYNVHGHIQIHTNIHTYIVIYITYIQTCALYVHTCIYKQTFVFDGSNSDALHYISCDLFSARFCCEHVHNQLTFDLVIFGELLDVHLGEMCVRQLSQELKTMARTSTLAPDSSTRMVP